MHNGGRRLVAAVLLPITLAACTRWKAEPLTPETLAEHEWVRVTRTAGGHVVLHRARIEGDSIVGQPALASSWTLDEYYPRFVVPLDDVAALKVREIDAAVTLLLVIGIPLALVVTVAITGDYSWY